MGYSPSKMKEIMEKQAQEQFFKQRQLMMQQRQVQLAMQFALGKERFLWFQAFYFTMTPFFILASVRFQNPIPLGLIVPISFIYGYQYDMYYWNKIQRVRQEAEKLIKEEPELFYLPENNGIFNQDEYNKALNLKQKTQ